MSDHRDERQRAVTRWAEETFGPVALDVKERATRLLEEAVEVAQAAGLTQAKAHAILLHVYSKPEGVIRDEVGGVGVCLLALCETLCVSADDAEREEFERVTALPREHFRARQNAKAAAGVAGPVNHEDHEHGCPALYHAAGRCKCAERAS